MNKVLFYTKRVFIYAAAWLIMLLSKILVKIFHLKRLQWLIGQPKKEVEKKPLSVQQKRKARKTGKYINKIKRYVFWPSVCLDQAIAAAIILRLLHIDFCVHLGLSREDKLKAHAWVTTGELTITGQHNKEDFTEISIFTPQT